jgi:hypothetical protein
MPSVNPFGVKIPDIRTTQHNGQTHYSIMDIIEAVSESRKKAAFWNSFKRQNELISDVVLKLEMPSRSLRQIPTDCANAEGILLILACYPKTEKSMKVMREMAKSLSDKLKQTKGTSLVKFIEAIE